MDPEATARAALSYTDFGDADRFEAYCRHHGLEFVGRIEDNPSTPFWWASPSTGVAILTGCHPVTGEHYSGDHREEGYCSYLVLRGPASFAEDAFRELVETATYIKAEFTPLTIEETETVLVSLHEDELTVGGVSA